MCGVMFEMPHNSNVYVGFESISNAHDSPEISTLVGKINEAGFSVVIECMDGIKRYSLTESQTREQMHDNLNQAIK